MNTSFIGTMNMLGLAKCTSARFLLTSTSEVGGSWLLCSPLPCPYLVFEKPMHGCNAGVYKLPKSVEAHMHSPENATHRPSIGVEGAG